MLQLKNYFMKKLLLSLTAFCGILISYAQGGTCATATVLTPGTYNYGTINGTYQQSTPACFTGTVPANGIWYSYTSAVEVYATLSTDLSSNLATADSRIQVFTGTCAALTCYAADDDVSTTAPVNYRTNLGFLAEANVTYYIQFDNRWAPDADGLNFDFSIVPTDCSDVLPYTENWSSLPNFAGCWEIESLDALAWGYNNGNDFNGDLVDDPVALIFPSAANNVPKNDWLISKGLTLNAGTNYNVKVKYNGFNAPVAANESIRVVMLNSPASTATIADEIGSVSGILQNGLNVTDLLPQATTQTFNYTPNGTGQYHVGIHANTPTAAGIIIVFEVVVEQNLSNNNFQASNLSVYPNPTKNIIYINNNLNAVVNSIEMSDLNGRVVKTQIINAAEGQVSISDLSAGVYMMKVITDQGTATKKVIKE